MGTSLPSNKIVSAERFMRGLGNERSAAGGRGGAVFFCKRLAAPASLQPYHRHTARPPGQTRPPLRPRGRQRCRVSPDRAAWQHPETSGSEASSGGESSSASSTSLSSSSPFSLFPFAPPGPVRPSPHPTREPDRRLRKSHPLFPTAHHLLTPAVLLPFPRVVGCPHYRRVCYLTARTQFPLPRDGALPSR